MCSLHHQDLSQQLKAGDSEAGHFYSTEAHLLSAQGSKERGCSTLEQAWGIGTNAGGVPDETQHEEYAERDAGANRRLQGWTEDQRIPRNSQSFCEV